MTTDNYSAIYTRISDIRKHTNADRLQIATVAGDKSVIVGLDHAVGEWGIYFPVGCSINTDFAIAMKLFQKHPSTGEKMGGYLDDKARIFTLKLRNEWSDGLWLPFTSMQDIITLPLIYSEGKEVGIVKIKDVGSIELCKRYVRPWDMVTPEKKLTKKKLSFLAYLKRQEKAPWQPTERLAVCFPEVGTTHQMGQITGKIEYPAAISITEKLHGTSGRSAKLQVKYHLTLFQKFINRFIEIFNAFLIAFCPNFIMKYKPEYGYQVVSGSRTQVRLPGRIMTLGKEITASYREVANDLVATYIHEHEVWYYEIVGLSAQNGKPIMARHTIPKDMQGDYKEYAANSGIKVLEVPTTVTYKNDTSEHPFEVYVYRILNTKTGKSLTGGRLELELMTRQEKHGEFPANLHMVPLFEYRRVDTEYELVELINSHLESLMLDGKSQAPREGVCLNVHLMDDSLSGITWKKKSRLFSACEGIAYRELEVKAASGETTEQELTEDE